MNNELSSKEMVRSGLTYWIMALKEGGCNDPVKKIVTELPKLINISDEQAMYLLTNSKEKIDVEQILNDILILILKAKEDKEFTNRTYKLIMNGLDEIRSIFNEADYLYLKDVLNGKREE
jgi:hypothetical protein